MKNPNKIKISGTYGDEVTLYLDGYVSTKYGDFLKIKHVDVDKGHVYCYGDYFDFSRISGSSPKKDGDKHYLDHLKYILNLNGIKKDSIVEINDIEYVVDEVVLPTLEGEDYYPILKLISKTDNSQTSFTLISSYTNYVKVLFTPRTLKEKLKKHLKDNTRFDNSIKDVDKYIDGLVELIEKEMKQ